MRRAGSIPATNKNEAAKGWDYSTARPSRVSVRPASHGGVDPRRINVTGVSHCFHHTTSAAQLTWALVSDLSNPINRHSPAL